MKLSKKKLITLYSNLVRSRAYDEFFIRRLKAGKLLGFYHPSEGGEAPGVGACSFLNDDDIIWPHHRGHGIPHILSKGVDIKYYLAEHCGKSTGLCGGRSSYHICAPEKGVYGTAGSIGSCFPSALGWGLGAQKNGRNQVVVCCFGDGASNRGTFHEAALMAANWKLPTIWLCENNQMSIYVHAREHHPTEHISDLAHGYGMPSAIVDGQDVIAVAEAVLSAVDRARKGRGPSFIECKTVRFYEHDIGTPDLVGSTPRSKAELAELRKRDPVLICRETLLKSKILTQKTISEIKHQAQLEIEEAERFADESPVTDAAVLSSALYAA